MKLFEMLWDVVTLPVDLVKDVVTIGGELVGKDDSYTKEKMKKLDKDIKE